MLGPSSCAIKAARSVPSLVPLYVTRRPLSTCSTTSSKVLTHCACDVSPGLWLCTMLQGIPWRTGGFDDEQGTCDNEAGGPMDCIAPDQGTLGRVLGGFRMLPARSWAA